MNRYPVALVLLGVVVGLVAPTATLGLGMADDGGQGTATVGQQTVEVTIGARPDPSAS